MKELALKIIEEHLVRINQENLPIPAHLQAEIMVEALVGVGVLGPYVLERGQGLNDQEVDQATSDSQPPTLKTIVVCLSRLLDRAIATQGNLSEDEWDDMERVQRMAYVAKHPEALAESPEEEKD